MILKLIPYTTNYYANDKGDIYSKFKKLRKLKPNIQTNKKYYYVNIKVKNKFITKRVHRLVCLAFHGIPNYPYHTVSHLDGNWKNNKPNNLKWESLSDNFIRKKQHGTDDVGIKNSRAKINLNILKEIRKHLKERKLTHKQIGELFRLNRVFITKIKNNMRYSGQGNE